jgi:zinc protease
LGEREELPNGLVWLFSEQRSVPLVAVNLLLKAGALRDPRGREGLAHLTALLLTQGTKKRTATQMAEEIDFLGAKLSAGAEEDYAMVSLTVLKKDVGQGLELMADAVLNPTFPPQELRRKVQQLLASFDSDEDEPMVIARRAFDQRLYGQHPYAFPPKGTPQGLKAIQRQQVVEFHRHLYRPNNAILSVVGDISREEARELILRYFGAWSPKGIPELTLPPLPSLSRPETQVIDKKITQANIIWGHLGITRQNPDFYAFQVMNYILGGGGFASRLMDTIRETRGLAYSVGSTFEPGLEPGPFYISLETKTENAGEAVALILKEVERLRTEPVSDTELADAKSYLIGSFPRRLDATGKRAALMAYVEFYGLGLDYPGRYAEIIRGITAADVQRVAQQYLHPERYLLVVAGDRSRLPRLPGLAAAQEEKEKNDAEN